MSELAKNFMIGLATILGLFLLALLLFYFGEFRLIRPAENEVTINMTMAGGIRPESPIELDGVPIGEVTDVTLRLADMRYPVVAKGRIESVYRIPVDYQATVERSLLAGTAILHLTSPRVHPEDGVALLSDDGSAELHVEVRTVLEEVLQELDKRTEPLLDALASFNRLSETYTTVGENINALIGEAGFDAEGKPGEPTLRSAVVRLNTVLDEASSALRLANVWLDDEQLRADFTGAVSNANALIEQASEAVAQYGRLAESLEEDADVLVQRLVPVTDELAETLADVRRVTALAMEGRGTIAQLLNNPDLYESLLDASIRLERALAEAQLLIQKFQQEGVPLRW